jgi:hypothetical protein
MGLATRTTKLLLDLGKRTEGGANNLKRAALEVTCEVLTQARAFYLDFFLAHADKLAERVTYYSEEHLEFRERLISAHELLTWAESCTVATAAHPHPWPGWNFSERFADMPFAYRRSVIKVAIGKARSYLSHHANWEKHGKQKGKPGLPAASDHPTLYQECLALDLQVLATCKAFVRINVYTGESWVITVRLHGQIIETVFVSDHGLDAHRYRHLKRIAKKQRQSGKPVACEHSNQQLWRHVDRLNEDAAHKVARRIAAVCASYPGGILLFERLRKINQYARDKAYVHQVVTVEVNPHGTSQYCSRCGAKGERFSNLGGKRIKAKWGKLFWCPVCHYEAHADFNASVNVHRSFYHEWHWRPRQAKAPALPTSEGG